MAAGIFLQVSKHSVIGPVRSIFFRKLLVRLLSPLLIVVAGAVLAHAENGLLSGSFSVNSGGGATYQIPIDTPPGIQGLKPQLSLSYSSQAANGQLGVGWTLSGFTYIQRCGQTIAQDGQTTGVDFGPSDRFCLNGQRLVNIDPAQTYYTNGAVYHTELESWTQVIGHNENGETCGEGPCSFTATMASGAQLEFGTMPDSRILAIGAPGSTLFSNGPKAGSVRVWALSRYTDTNGNSIEFHYTTSPKDTLGQPVSGAANLGAYYPERINYTSNSGQSLAPQRSVQLYYEGRGDVSVAYQGGAYAKTAARLSVIETCIAKGRRESPDGVADRSCSELQKVSSYELTYCDKDADCTEASTTGRSVVSSIAQCDADGNCLTPTVFGWQRGQNGLAFINGSAAGKLETSYAYCAEANGQLTWADFDGNGLPDFICDNASAQPSLGTVRVLLNDGSQLAAPPNQSADGELNVSAECVNGVATWRDLNGDSLADWLCNDLISGAVKALFSNGQTLVSPHGTTGGEIPGTTAACVAPGQLVWADFNGDSRADWICADSKAGTFYVMLSDGNNLVSINNESSHDWLTARLTYDGIASCPSSSSVSWADFNADGMVDWICDDPSLPQTSVFLSTGDSLISANPANVTGLLNSTQTVCMGVTSGTAVRLWADFNGDHLADWICNDFGAQGNVRVMLSTGVDLTSASDRNDGLLPISGNTLARCQSGSGSNDQQVAWTDFNGDELIDWVCSNVSLGQSEILLSTGDSLYPVNTDLSIPRCQTSGANVYVLNWFDFNGDGLSDAVCTERATSSPGTGQVWVALHDPAMPDLMNSMTDGIGGQTLVQYEPLTNPDVYTRTESDYPLGQMLGYPEILVNVPSYVVAGYTLQNADDRNSAPYSYQYAYHYEEGMIGLGGRGWLGFSHTTMRDLNIFSSEAPKGVQLTSHYSQIYPFTSVVKSRIYCENSGNSDRCRLEDPHYVAYAAEYLCEDPEAGNCTENKAFQPYAGVYQRLKTKETQSNTKFGSRIEKTYAYNNYGQVVRYSNLGDVGNNSSNPVYTCQNYANSTQPGEHWYVGLTTDSKVSASSVCPADQAAWDAYAYDPATDFSWQHTDYDPSLNIQNSVSWDQKHGGWLGRAFEYDGAVGNKTGISKISGATLAALSIAPNSTYKIAFDDNYQTYPAELTTPEAEAGEPDSALSAQLAFDMRFGGRVGLVDLNGHVTTTCLDGFGRTVYSQGPQPDTGGGKDVNCLSASTYSYLPGAFGSASVVTLSSSAIDTPSAGDIVLKQVSRQTWNDSWATAQKLTSETYIDGLGRSYKAVSPGEGGNVTVLTEYQGQKRVSRTSFPFYTGTPQAQVRWTEKKYDVFGHPLSVTAPYEGGEAVINAVSPCTADDPQTTSTTCYSYTAPNTVTVTQAANTAIAQQKTVRFDYYNALKRPVSMTTDGTTSFEFDLVGRPTRIVDPAGVRSEIRYDSLGRRVFLGSLDTGARIFGYDALGVLQEQHDGRHTRVAFSYDGLNRLLSKDYYPDGSDSAVKSIAFSYDNSGAAGLENTKGRKASASLVDHLDASASSTYLFGYDGYGRTNASNLMFEGETYPSAVSYNPNGTIADARLPDPQQSMMAFHFGTAGLLETVEMGANGNLETYLTFDNYTAIGQPGQVEYRNGVLETYDYTTTGVLSRQAIVGAGNDGAGMGEQLLNDAYAWDSLGQITKILDCNFADNPAEQCADVSGMSGASDGTQRFSYVSSRLTNAEGVYGEEAYDYAPGGNMIRKGDVTYDYKSQRPEFEGAPSHQVASGSDGMTASYDGNGNMIAKTAEDGDWNLTYDVLNKMVSASRDGVLSNTFVYDYTGRRLKKVTFAADGVMVANTVRYISPYVETTDYGEGLYPQVTRYIPGVFGRSIAITGANDPAPNELVGEGVPSPDSSISLHQNLVASTVLTTDAAGRFNSRVDYLPYGEIYKISPSASANHFRPKYDGHELDDGINIYDFNARYYDQGVARFRSADTSLGAGPLGQDAFNRYEINLSNPISLTDPTGNTGCGGGGYLLYGGGGALVGGVLGGIGGGVAGLITAAVGGWDNKTADEIAVGETLGGVGIGAVTGAGLGAGYCNLKSNNDTSDKILAGNKKARKIERDKVNEMKRRNKLKKKELKLKERELDNIEARNKIEGENYKQRKRYNDLYDEDINSDTFIYSESHEVVEYNYDCSFNPDTKVLTQLGSLTPIGDLKPGDTVLGHKPAPGETGAFEVTRTFERQADSFYRVKIGAETIDVTAGHRFKVLDGDWVKVEDLNAGDLIQDIQANGHEFRSRELVSEPARVHSMSVSDVRNYHITGSGLLVHNCPFRPKSQPEELGSEADAGEFFSETAGIAGEGSDIAAITGEVGTDAAAIGESTAIAAEGATDLVEGAAAVAGGAEIGSDIMEGLIIVCAALCWL